MSWWCADCGARGDGSFAGHHCPPDNWGSDWHKEALKRGQERDAALARVRELEAECNALRMLCWDAWMEQETKDGQAVAQGRAVQAKDREGPE